MHTEHGQKLKKKNHQNSEGQHKHNTPKFTLIYINGKNTKSSNMYCKYKILLTKIIFPIPLMNSNFTPDFIIYLWDWLLKL